MSKMIKLYDEIFKLAKLIDSKWDEIITRKDESIRCGDFIIKKTYGVWGDENDQFWRISIECTKGYSSTPINVISFYERGDMEPIPSIVRYYQLVLTSSSDVLIYTSCPDGGNFRDTQCTIPYDRSAGPEERRFSVDIAYEDSSVREILYRVIEFQEMKLNHVDLFSYNFEMICDMVDGLVYNELIKRPFFRYGVKK